MNRRIPETKIVDRFNSNCFSWMALTYNTKHILKYYGDGELVSIFGNYWGTESPTEMQDPKYLNKLEQKVRKLINDIS